MILFLLTVSMGNLGGVWPDSAERPDTKSSAVSPSFRRRPRRRGCAAWRGGGVLWCPA